MGGLRILKIQTANNLGHGLFSNFTQTLKMQKKQFSYSWRVPLNLDQVIKIYIYFIYI